MKVLFPPIRLKHLRTLPLWLICLSFCASLFINNSHADEGYHREQFLQFGTIIDVQLDQVTQLQAKETMAALEQMFAEWHKRWNPWGDGELGEFNRALSGQKEVAIPALLQPIIIDALHYSRLTDGYFDPGVGRLVRLWGFSNDEVVQIEPPANQTIQALLVDPGVFLATDWKQPTVRPTQPMQLDFGGFLKGAALDESIRILQQHEVNDGLINAGGDIRAIGQRHEQKKNRVIDRPWRVGIKHPRENRVLAALDIGDDEVVFTSGDYERYFVYKNQRYHHILDPHTGFPGIGLSSVTVITSEGSLGDAAATALMAAGKDHWRSLLQKLPLSLVMIVDNNGSVFVSKELETRLWFEKPIPDIKRIGD